MKTVRSRLLNLAMGLGLLLNVGCFENAAILSVKKDGSATLVIRNYMSPQVSGMMDGGGAGMMEALMGGLNSGKPVPPKPETTSADIFKKIAQDNVAQLGDGVKLIAFGEQTNKKGWKGFLAKYSVPDVNTLKLTLGDMNGVGNNAPGRLGGLGGAAAAPSRYTFAFTKGDVSSLKIIPANKKAEVKPTQTGEVDVLLNVLQEENAAGASADGTAASTPPPQGAWGADMGQMMGPMMAGLRVVFMVQVEGGITETDSSYTSKSRKDVITVVDIPVDKMIGHQQAMPILMDPNPTTRATRLSKLNVPGVKASDADKEITINFK